MKFAWNDAEVFVRTNFHTNGSRFTMPPGATNLIDNPDMRIWDSLELFTDSQGDVVLRIAEVKVGTHSLSSHIVSEIDRDTAWLSLEKRAQLEEIIFEEFGIDFDRIEYNWIFMPNPSGTMNPSMPLVQDLAALNLAGFPNVTSTITFLLPS